MYSQRRFVMFSTATITISALAAGLAALSATLGAPAGAIVLGEMCGFACLVTFTLLIWGAILDGRQPDRGPVE
jgi:hypothetical protein